MKTTLPVETCPSLLIFSDDWGRHPSSCQHLARVLGKRYRIWWVNTIGTRRPNLDLATIRRAAGKARQWLHPTSAAQLSGNPTVLNPRMWPYFRSSLDRRINRVLLARQLTPVIAAAGSPVIAITTISVVADLVGKLPVDRWVYYGVDNYEEWPGLDRTALRLMEGQLLRHVDTVIAVSAELQRKFADMGRQAEILTHGVEFDRWACDGDDVHAPDIPCLAGVERPLIVFWGVVDRRLDVPWLQRLGADLDRGTIVLVGPEADPDPELGRIPRVVRVGPIPFESLPGVAQAAAVLIMPYADLPVTRAMQPLKLKEYLATGRPVVVRDLPATREWSGALDIVATPESFSAAVRSRLSGAIPTRQTSSRACLRDEGWAAKAAVFEQLALG